MAQKIPFASRRENVPTQALFIGTRKEIKRTRDDMRGVGEEREEWREEEGQS